jgi:L-arabinokinase
MMDDESPFSTLLDKLEKHPRAELRDLLDRERPLMVARAPACLDVMGGIADYSGATVLQMPLGEGTYVAIQQSPVLGVRAASVELGDAKRHRYAEITPHDLAMLLEAGEDGYATARAFFRREEKSAWLAYVVGALLVLAHERSILLTEGLSLVVAGGAPEGKGVSASAAVEVATLFALTRLFGVSLDGEELAIACQSVENFVVGTPSTVTDAMTAAVGQAGRLLEIDCQGSTVSGARTVPDSLALWGIDSGVRHGVKGSAYTGTRVAAFMGYRVIADICGYQVAAGDAAGHVQIEDPDFAGFLANIDVHQFNRRFLQNLPERMQGGSFLDRYGGITDPLTEVEPQRSYAVRACTAHPVQEQQRIQTFAKLVERAGPGSAALLSELMRQSHRSYSECDLGTQETDLIVELVESTPGLHGAKITGRGGGGRVAVVGNCDAGELVQGVVQTYESHTGNPARIVSGSSPGATLWGIRRGQYRLGRWWLD